MSIKADFHLHSSFSGDAHIPMEEMIQQGIQTGLTTMCFTEHMDMDYPPPNGTSENIFLVNTDSYLYDLLHFREKYRDKIKLLFGIELGIQAHIIPELEHYIESYPFDFVIASSHLCGGVDPYFSAYYEGKSEWTSYHQYFESILENVKSFSNFDVYGHLDYIVRYGPNKNKFYTYEDHKDVIDEILRILIRGGKGIELNTGGYKYGLGVPNPCPEILKRYNELGGKIITIGSDAHTPEYIGSYFNEAREVLLACGFTHYTTFEKRTPTFIKL